MVHVGCISWCNFECRSNSPNTGLDHCGRCEVLRCICFLCVFVGQVASICFVCFFFLCVTCTTNTTTPVFRWFSFLAGTIFESIDLLEKYVRLNPSLFLHPSIVHNLKTCYDVAYKPTRTNSKKTIISRLVQLYHSSRR